MKPWLWRLAAALGFLAFIVACVLVMGCTPALQGVKTAQREENAAGQTAAAYLYKTCDYDAAQTQADIDALDAIECVPAANALTDVSAADGAVVALVDAYEAGQCVATIARDVPPRCDLLAAAKRVKDAAARLKTAADRVKARAAK